MTDIYQRAIDKWGPAAQWQMVSEKCIELALEVQRLKRERTTYKALANELADVEIVCAQAHLMLVGVRDTHPLQWTAKRLFKLGASCIWAHLSDACMSMASEIVREEMYPDPDYYDYSIDRVQCLSLLDEAVIAARKLLGDALVDKCKAQNLARLQELIDGK
jgi:hypothetical protein